MVDVIFDAVAEADEEIEYTLKVSYVEIYMERIRDLLEPSRTNLAIREDKHKGLTIDATEVYMTSADDFEECMRLGQQNRAVAATNMNEESSRSHSIFIVTVVQRNSRTESEMRGKLYLVDLAGSEKVGKTNAAGQALEEAKTINKSLSALGKVINDLTDGKSSHISYRDSKLTRLLQESLGGNSRTTLLLHCSISSYNRDETVSTLRFGQRAKAIKNKAQVNLEMSVTEMKILLAAAEKETAQARARVEDLEAELRRRGGTSRNRPSESVEGSMSPEPAVTGEECENDMDHQGMAEMRIMQEDLLEQLAEKIQHEEVMQEVQDDLLEQLQEKDIELQELNMANDEIMEGRSGHVGDLERENDVMREMMDELRYELEEKVLQLQETTQRLEHLEADMELLRSAMPTSADEVEGISANLESMKLSTSPMSSDRPQSFSSPVAFKVGEEGQGYRAVDWEVIPEDTAAMLSKFESLREAYEKYTQQMSKMQADREAEEAERRLFEETRIEGEEEKATKWSEHQEQYLQRARSSEMHVEELLASLKDKDAQFEQFKLTFKGELETKCKQIVQLELNFNEEKEKNHMMMNSGGSHDLLQAKNTMSMARRLRTQETEIVSLHKTRRELEQLKTTQTKMLAHRDERIAHLTDRVEELTKRLDSVAVSEASGKSPPHGKGGKVKENHGLAGLRMAVPLRGGGRRGKDPRQTQRSPLKALCEQAEDQWKNARAAARWGLAPSQVVGGSKSVSQTVSPSPVRHSERGERSPSGQAAE